MNKRFTTTRKITLALFMVVCAFFLAFGLINLNSSKSTTLTASAETTSVSSLGGTLSSGEYQLSADITATDAITVESGSEVTIDLNGHTLTLGSSTATGSKTASVINSGTLTIKDSSSEDTGKLDASAGNYGVYSTGTFELAGGTIYVEKSGVSAYGIYISSTSTTTISGGTLHVYNTSGYSAYGVYASIDSARIIISGGTIDSYSASSSSYGIFTSKAVTIEVSGCIIKSVTESTSSSVYAYGVYIKNNSSSVSLTINNGDITATSSGIYAYGKLITVVISGDYTEITGNNWAIYGYCSSITISGGTFSGAQYAYHNFGSSSATANTTISGGTFKAGTGYSDIWLGAYHNATITGGTFDTVELYTETTELTISNSLISDSTFVYGDGYELFGETGTDETQTIYTIATTENSAYAYVINNNTTTYYATFNSAINGASSGDTLVLLKDVSGGVAPSKSLTIDLNGHNWTTSGSVNYCLQIGYQYTYYIINSSSTQSVISYNYTLSSATVGAIINYGTLEISGNIKITAAGNSSSSYGVFGIYTGYKSGASKAGNTTINDGVEIYATNTGDGEGAGIGVYGSGNSNYYVTLTVNGGTIYGDTFGIAGNGSQSSSDYRYTAITINGGTIGTDGTNVSVVGIFHPQIGDLTINGGSVTGVNSAIEMRSGSLTITDGTFTATAESFSEDGNSSGTTMVGVAVAISQHTTNNDISVSISGGTFKGVYAVYEKDLQDSSVSNIEIEISGGSYTSTATKATAVYSQNVSSFISGGTYNSNVSTYAATGFTTTEITSGTYGITLSNSTNTAAIYYDGSYTYYATLAAAITDISDGYIGDTSTGTSVSGQDVTIKLYAACTETLTIPASLSQTYGINLIIDLNGYTLSSTGSTLTVESGATLTIKDNASGGTVSTSGTSAYAVTNNGTLTIASGTIDGTNGVYNSGSLTIDGGAVKGDTYALYQYNGSAVINGGTFECTEAIYQAAGTITINAGTFTNAQYVIEQYSGTLEIYGGTFSATGIVFLKSGTTGTITVYGGSFGDKSVVSYIASGAVIVDDTGTSGYYVVYESETMAAENGIVAVVEGYGYATVTEALAAAAATDTIKLIADVTETSALTISNGTDITLNLNGYTLTITGYATVDISSTTKYVGILNNGTLTIEDSTGNGAIAVANDNVNYGIGNFGTLTIKAGTISSTNSANSTFTIYNGGTAALTVEGGTIIGETRAISSAGTLDISGGTLTADSLAVLNNGTGTINGGTISGGSLGVVNNGTLTISAGTISGTFALQSQFNTSSTTITGGTFIGTSVGVVSFSAPITLGTEGGNDEDIVITGEIAVEIVGDSSYGNGTVTMYSGTIGNCTIDGVDYESTWGVGMFGYSETSYACFTMYNGSITADSFAISGNGSTGQGYDKLYIYGGEITSVYAAAIYNPQQTGVTYIMGGTITGQSGIEIRNGSVYIGENYNTDDLYYANAESLTIVATGDPLTANPNYSGSTIQGAAIAIATYNLTTITVSVGEGTYTSASGYAVYEANVNGYSTINYTLNVELTDGTYTGTIYSETASTTTTTFEVSGGSYSDTSAAAYVAEGSALSASVDSEGYFGVVASSSFVATVNGLGYSTLAEAIDAAADGDTVVLTSDVSDEQVTISGKAIVLDLNGHTISYDGTVITIESGAQLTISTSDGTISSTSTSDYAILNNGTLVIEGGSISASYCAISTSGTTTISGGTITGGTAGVYTSGGTVTISGGTISGTYAVYNVSGSVTISGGTITGTTAEITSYGGSVTVSGGTVTKLVTSSTNVTITGGTIGADSEVVITGGTVSISGGTFKDAVTLTGTTTTIEDDATFNGTVTIDGGTVTIEGGTFATLNVVGGTVTISGGTFANDVSDYVADSYTVVYNGTLYEVVSSDSIVAKIGSLGYSTLQDAIDAAGTTATTITLVADTTEDITIAENQNITLDLNGHTLTNVSGHTITVESGATLTIEGDGIVDNVTHAKAAIYNLGTVTLNGGTYTRSQEASTSASNNGDNSYYVLVNHGTMTINSGVTVGSYTDGTATDTVGKYSSLVQNGWFTEAENTAQTTSYLTINGGTFLGGLNTVKNGEYGTLVIEGGTFTNTYQNVIMNWNSATISGGTFTATDTCTSVIWDGYYNTDATGSLTITGGTFTNVNGGDVITASATYTGASTVTISGGTFTGVINLDSAGTAAISGGTYSDTSAAAYLVSGYTLGEATASGYYTPVSTTNIVAKIGSLGYSTLQDAIDAASDGDTITLVASTTASVTISGKNIVLNLGGYTLTSDEATTITVESGATLTVSTDSGTIENTYASGYAILNNGTLNVEGGTITGAYGIYNYGTLNITGGTISSSTGIAIETSGTSANVTIGEQGGSNDALKIEATGTAYAIRMLSGATVDIYSGTITSATHAIAIFGDNANNYTTLNVYGGSITAKLFAIANNGGTGDGYAIINVEGGTITSSTEAAIYLPAQYGVTTISGGTIVGSTGIEIRNGSLEITGGSISSNATTETDFGAIANDRGNTVNGVALAISAYNQKDITVTISGGEFYGYNYTVYECFTNASYGTALNVSVSPEITGGTFDGEVYAQNATAFISGGTYSDTSAAAYVVDGSMLNGTAVSGYYGIQATTTYVASIGSVGYETLQLAIDAAADGEIVTLLTNVFEDIEITSGTITLDLDGYTLTNSTDTSTITVSGSSTSLTIEGAGKVINTADTSNSLQAVYVYDGATLIVNDATLSGTYNGIRNGRDGVEGGTVILNSGASVIGTSNAGIQTYGTVTVNDGATVEGKWGITFFGKDSTNYTTVTINGGIITGTGDSAISSNGKTGYGYVELIISGGTITSNAATAIYLPATDGKATISGGTITGVTGVEIRAGSLTISGTAVITATGSFSVTANGNGSTVEGAAVAISQHTTNKDITVTITGGTFNGEFAIYETDTVNGSADGVTASITGGTFNGSVYSDNLTEFISGGTYSDTSAAAYLVSGYTLGEATASGYYMLVETNDIVAMIGSVGYGSLAEAIAAAADGDEITLVASTTASVTISGKNIVLNLNGNTLTSAEATTITVENGATLTVSTDSGTIENTNASGYAILNNGTLNVEGGTITGAYGIYNYGTLNITGGTISSSTGIAIETSGTSANVTIGEQGGANDALTIQATGSAYAIRMLSGATVDIYSGTITSVTHAIAIFGDDENNYTTLNVYGGSITATLFAIANNGGTGDGYAIINVEGGTITSSTEAAIYLPAQYGVTTISGGTIVGSTGIEIRNGSLTITGGSISSNAKTETDFGAIANDRGNTVNGVALAISAYNQEDITVTISGGEFYGYNYTVYECFTNASYGTALSVSVSPEITGGTFDGEVYAQNATEFISGGYLSEVADSTYYASGYVPTEVTIEGVTYYTVKSGYFATKPTVDETIFTNVSDVYTVTYTSNEFTFIADGTGYTVVGGTGTEVGTYTVTVYLESGYVWTDGTSETLTYTFEITQATNTLSGTLEIMGWTYGGTANDPSGLTADFGTISYKYYSDAACTSEVTDITTADAGTYYVVAYVAETANYTAAESSAVSFTISKAANVISVTIDGWTYGDTAGSPEATVTGEQGTVTYTYYSDANCTNKIDITTAGAGTYYVVAYVEETTNYLAAVSSAVAFTIAHRAITITVNDASITYGDEAPSYGYTVTSGSVVDGDTITVTYNCSYVQYNDVDTYTISATASNDNYDITFVNGTLTVTAKAITVTISNNTSVYGNDVTVDQSAYTATDVVNSDDLGITLTTTATNTSDVGSYEITGTWTNTNYDVTFVSGTWTITKASVEIPEAVTTTYTYDGSEQTYGITSTDTYTVSGNVQTNAGTYTVTVTLNDTYNYQWSDGTTAAKTFTFTINKATVTAPSEDTTTFTYTGSEQTYTIASNSAYTVSGNVQTNAGTYTVTVTLNDTDNYQWDDNTTAARTFTFTINKATVTAPSEDTTTYTYTGSEQTYTIASNSAYTVSGNVQTNAGTYTVTVTLNDTDNYQWSDDTTAAKTFTFTINKATVTAPTVTTTSFDFDGTEKTFITVDSDALYTAEGTTSATQIGTYNVVLVLKDSDNYQWASGATTSFTWTISDGGSYYVAIPTASADTFVYDGTEKSFVLATNAGYEISGDTTGTEVGTYTVTLTLDANHKWLDGSDEAIVYTWTITEAELTVTSTDGTAVYDGKTHTGSVSAATVDNSAVTIKYGTAEGTYDLDEAPAYTNAGTYTVYYQVTAENHTAATGSYTVTISKATYDMTGIELGNATATYNGTAHSIAISGTLPEGVTVSYVGSGISVGTYTIIASFSGDSDNYEAIANMTATLTITKASVTAPSADGTAFTYNGSEQTYTIAENDAYTVIGSKQTNAGTYTVTVTLNDTANYQWSDGTTAARTFTFTIAKASVTAPSEDTTAFTYTGSAQTYTVEENSAYTVSGNVQTNAGTYTVTVTLNDTANYQWSDGTTAAKTFTFTIAKASITAPSADGTTFTYNGSEQTYTIAANDAYTVIGSKQTAAGTYTVTVTLNDTANYQWSDGTTAAKTFTFTIVKAANSVTDPTVDGTSVSGSTATYGTVTYKYYADEACTEEITDVSGYETYYVRAEVAEGDNYYGAVSGAVEITAESEGYSALEIVSISSTAAGIVVAIALAGILIFMLLKKKK